MGKINTVGELKKLLEEFSDNMPIIHYSHGIERSGYFEGIWTPYVNYVSKTENDAWDTFDGTHYTYECYVLDENGQEALVI